MNTSFLHYLIVSSVYLFSFLLIYRLLISNLTHFAWMRAYLLISLTLSMVLPLITFPNLWSQSMLGSISFVRPLLITFSNPENSQATDLISSKFHEGLGLNIWTIFVYTLITIYSFGVFYRSIILFQNLKRIFEFVKRNPKYKEGKFWIIELKGAIPAFSFFNFIFINQNYEGLSDKELKQIKDHELIHSKQYHSIDRLFVELCSILFWFNPAVKYLKNSVQEVHEYLADEKMINNAMMKKNYMYLLLNLTSEVKSFGLSSCFSGKQISRRILMLSKIRSSNVHKLIFTLIIPIAVFLLLSFSYLDSNSVNPSSNNQDKEVGSDKRGSIKIGNIIWEGNTVFTDDELSNYLGLKKGDDYPGDILNSPKWYDENGISTKYLDKGYLYFNAEMIEKKTDAVTVDLTFLIKEGNLGRFGEVTVKGNVKVPTADIMEKILIRSGDLFSKTALVNSIRALSMMGKFDPERVHPKVMPVAGKTSDGFTIVNIEFEVVEN